MQDQFRIRPRLLALAVASALAAGATATQAAPTFLLSATANTSGSTGPGTDIMDSNVNGGDFFASPAGPTGSLFYHTYGQEFFGSTQFGARVSGEGSAFFGRTGVRYTETISNVGNPNAIVGSFSFYVDSGQIGLFG
ncbi:MAG: hypothetical protein JNM90_13425, partial [Burkholderiales bacterium]|nr:hypothetical protein [Burkholderiales bacterium]